MHRLGEYGNKGVVVALNPSTHRVLVQYHGVSKSVHPRISNINITTNTPKGVTLAPFSNSACITVLYS